MPSSSRPLLHWPFLGVVLALAGQGCGSDIGSDSDPLADGADPEGLPQPGNGDGAGTDSSGGDDADGAGATSDDGAATGDTAGGAEPGSEGSSPSADGTGATETPQDSGGAEPGSSSGSGIDASADAAADACAELGGALDVGLTKLRRLTRSQLDNTLRDLLGVVNAPASAISPDAAVGPFENNAFNPATDLVVEQHQEMAHAIALEVTPRMGELSSCDLAADTTTACATEFVEQFGHKAFRRPLLDEEVQAYVGLFALGRAEADASNGFRLVVEAMLQSPFFLYHWDVGDGGAPVSSPVAVTGYELASRLSYFIWNTMPDEALFAVAADGSLTDPSVIGAEVDRMLADAKAADGVRLFHLQWLKVYDMSGVEKAPELYPDFSSDTVRAMQEETAAFTDYVVRQGDGLMSSLFLADYSFIDPSLAPYYGVSAPAAGQPVTFPAGQRAGVLTQAAFLAQHAHREITSPVRRGIAVRENILCQTIPPPPAGVNTTLPPKSDATTTRERFAQHLEDPTCASCHTLMDPIGLSFEHYGPMGEWRTEDGPNEVDASGEIIGASAELDGNYYGAVELAQKLANSDQVANCLANQWFRFALGRMESDLDACTISKLRTSFQASGHNVRELMKELATSDAFRNVRATAQ